jgi:pilus assembly protein CpaE
MQTSSSNSNRVVQAVFSVCVPDDVAVAISEVVVAVPGSDFLGQFQEYITAEKRPQFPDVVKEAAGCVALVYCDRDPELALQTMDRLQATFRQKLKLIAIASRTDTEFLVRAMRSGCDDFLAMPIDKALLTEALKRFQKGHLVDSLPALGKGKVISVCGVKGGVGTTTMAVHLAMHLVRKHGKRVLLIDHKHELGHVALHLGLKESVYHFDELVRNASRLDSDLLDGFVTRHSSGLEVIPSPDACSRLNLPAADAVGIVLEYLRTRYDFVLIDSSLQQVAELTAILTASDEVHLVCTPDVAALRDLLRRIDHLSSVAGVTGKLRVVINRSTSDGAVSTQDIETAVRLPIVVSVPNNYADLMQALNAGEPISTQHGGGFTRAIAQWTNRLVADPAPQPSKSSPAEPKRRFSFGF